MASLPKAYAAASVTWRPMRASDVPRVAELEAQIHAAPWTAGNFCDALAAGYGAVVAERLGRIVAFGVLMLVPGEAQLLNLSVVPAARREGLGRELLLRFLSDALRLGADQVFLEVRVSNEPAIALYESEGFVRIARRVAYYPPGADGQREDALVMRRNVGARP